MILIIVVITVFANLADILLKLGANEAGSSLGNPAAIFLTPWIWIGGALGVAAMAMWVYILGRHHISHAYPIFVGLGFLNVTLAAWLYFHETISPLRLAGIVVVLAGIVVVHLQSAHPAAAAAGDGPGGESVAGRAKAAEATGGEPR